MIKRILLSVSVLAALGLAGTPAHAGYKTGMQLLKECTTQPGTANHFQDDMFCLGYLAGVVDESFCQSPDTRHNFQLGEHVTLEQVKSIVIKWLQDNPDKLNFGAGSIVDQVLIAAFPCGQT